MHAIHTVVVAASATVIEQLMRRAFVGGACVGGHRAAALRGTRHVECTRGCLNGCIHLTSGYIRIVHHHTIVIITITIMVGMYAYSAAVPAAVAAAPDAVRAAAPRGYLQTQPHARMLVQLLLHTMIVIIIIIYTPTIGVRLRARVRRDEGSLRVEPGGVLVVIDVTVRCVQLRHLAMGMVDGGRSVYTAVQTVTATVPSIVTIVTTTTIVVVNIVVVVVIDSGGVAGHGR